MRPEITIIITYFGFLRESPKATETIRKRGTRL